jgi:hypothetical protein
MKNSAIAVFAALALIAGLSGCSKNSGLKDAPPEVKLYGVESARIEYEYTGDVTGKKTVTIANFGMYETQTDEFTMKTGATPTDVKSQTIRVDTLNYTIDLKTKTGQKAPFSFAQLKEMTKSFTAEQKENLNAELIQSMMGGKKAGTEEILGKKCDIFDLQGGGKIWMWKGLVMKQEMPMGQMKLALIAKKIETDISLSIADFTPGTDIKISEPSPMGMPPGHPQVDPKGGGQDAPPPAPAPEGSGK